MMAVQVSQQDTFSTKLLFIRQWSYDVCAQQDKQANIFSHFIPT